jgi:hypothetical protein
MDLVNRKVEKATANNLTQKLFDLAQDTSY